MRGSISVFRMVIPIVIRKPTPKKAIVFAADSARNSADGPSPSFEAQLTATIIYLTKKEVVKYR